MPEEVNATGSFDDREKTRRPRSSDPQRVPGVAMYAIAGSALVATCLAFELINQDSARPLPIAQDNALPPPVIESRPANKPTVVDEDAPAADAPKNRKSGARLPRTKFTVDENGMEIYQPYMAFQLWEGEMCYQVLDDVKIVDTISACAPGYECRRDEPAEAEAARPGPGEEREGGENASSKSTYVDMYCRWKDPLV